LPTNPFEFNPKDVVAFVLILVRLAGLFITAPIYSSRNIPPQLKAAWVLLMTFLVFPVISYHPADLPAPGLALGLAVLKEASVGMCLGFGALLLFTGIQMAGQIIDIQMGLGMVNIIDPVTSAQISVMGQFYFLIASLVFLSVNGHHLLIKAVVDSFNILPLGEAHFTGALGTEMMHLFSNVFFIAFRVGAPVIGALFITNLALGVVARTVPQMNVFIVGMPLNMGVGLLIVTFSMSFFVYVLQDMFHGLNRDLAILIHALK
jgi:flagellar biosynthetic protein FliR